MAKLPENKFVEISIDKLVKADWNYKQENPELSVKLIENIKRNGQIENIIVRLLPTGFYEIVNGNHRYDALLSLGIKSVWCFNLGDISDAKAKRIAIETNETKFATDTVKLASVLHELQGAFTAEDMIATMPYSQEELANYLKMHTFNWEDYDKDKAEKNTGASHEVAPPKRDDQVHFTLSPEALNIWNSLRAKLKTQEPGLSDYDIFVRSIRNMLDANTN